MQLLATSFFKFNYVAEKLCQFQKAKKTVSPKSKFTSFNQTFVGHERSIISKLFILKMFKIQIIAKR